MSRDRQDSSRAAKMSYRKWPCLILLLALVDSSFCSSYEVLKNTTTTLVPTYTWYYNQSSIIQPSVDIHTNGSGSIYAFACQSASQSWESESSAMLNNGNQMTTIPIFTTVSTLTQDSWEIWTTDCDGIVHARGTAPTASSVYSTTSTWTNYTIPPSITMPQPSCMIRPADCKAVLESYTTESTALSKWEAQLPIPHYVTGRPSMPSCTSICTATPDCMIMGDHVRLIYWPVTVTGTNSCGTNGTTVSTFDSKLRTIVSLGTTFTSPTAYISFHSLSAWDWNCRTQMGQGVSGTIIAVPPGSLSSARGWHLGRSAYSYNLADLNGFVTSAAYFEMQGYDWSGPGETIFDDLYFPTIWLPDSVTEMRPEWSTCSLSPFGVEDPPIALTSVAFLTKSEAKPIETPGYKLTTAVPAATASTNVAPMTVTKGPDPLATTKPASSAAETHFSAGVLVSTQSSKDDIGLYIASALGLQHPTTTSPAVIEVVGSQVSVHDQDAMPLSKIYAQIISEITVQGTDTPSVTAYGVAYTMVDGHTAVAVGDTMLSIGGAVTEIDGYVVSAATGGVVINGLVIPYAAAETSAVSLSTSIKLESKTPAVSSSASKPSSTPSQEQASSSSARTIRLMMAHAISIAVVVVFVTALLMM